jgi:hypothetical protein
MLHTFATIVRVYSAATAVTDGNRAIRETLDRDGLAPIEMLLTVSDLSDTFSAACETVGLPTFATMGITWNAAQWLAEHPALGSPFLTTVLTYVRADGLRMIVSSDEPCHNCGPIGVAHVTRARADRTAYYCSEDCLAHAI